MTNFNNSIESHNGRISKGANDLNKLSADFSNHVGDFKSQVKSLEQHVEDFNEYKNVHQKVHSKQDADFKDLTSQLDSFMLDFQNHTTDYTLHKKPWDVRKKEAQADLAKRGLYGATLKRPGKAGKVGSMIQQFISRIKGQKK
jgi:hypothetical protein